MPSFRQVMSGLDWTVLLNILISVIPALVCLTVHELAHGFTAYRLGDTTAKERGRLTLNPIKHIDPWGFLSMIFFRFGWAKAVPVNMSRFKNPKAGMAITALAGPLSNFILAALFLFILGILLPVLSSDSPIINFLYVTASLSVALGLFNLIPIPPLDGSKVLFSLLPSNVYYFILRYERFGMILLILVLMTDVFAGPLYFAVDFILNSLMVFIDFGISIMLRFMQY